MLVSIFLGTTALTAGGIVYSVNKNVFEKSTEIVGSIAKAAVSSAITELRARKSEEKIHKVEIVKGGEQ